jgi:hypothetical protein
MRLPMMAVASNRRGRRCSAAPSRRSQPRRNRVTDGNQGGADQAGERDGAGNTRSSHSWMR